MRFAGRAGLLFSYSTRLITDSDATSYQYQPLPLLPPGTTLTPRKPKLKTESRPQSPPNCEVVVCSDWAVVGYCTVLYGISRCSAPRLFLVLFPVSEGSIMLPAVERPKTGPGRLCPRLSVPQIFSILRARSSNGVPGGTCPVIRLIRSWPSSAAVVRR